MSVFTSLPPSAGEIGGGFGNAIIGTLIMVGIATLISVPFGILAAVFLAEVGPTTRLAQFVRFGAKMLSGFPSVLAGVLAYGAIVLLTGGFSAWAGGIALSLLMLPTVILTAEDAIRMVPAENSRSGHRHGRDQHADNLARDAADCHAGNSYRSDAGRRAGRRRNGSAACSPPCSATIGSTTACPA